MYYSSMKTTAEEVLALYKANKIKLTKRESDVISRYYGFGKHNRHTLQEIGTLYSLTRERVRQIKQVALTKISLPL